MRRCGRQYPDRENTCASFGRSPVTRRDLVSVCVAATVAIAAAACGSNPSAAAPGTSGSGRGGGRGRGGDSGAAPVVTAKVVEKDVPVDIAAIGNVEASTTISVRSQITGQLQEA